MTEQEQKEESGIGCLIQGVILIGIVALEQLAQHSYQSSTLTSLRADAKDELSNQILSNPAAHLDQEVAIRGELLFEKSEKPSHLFSTPYGLNFYTKSDEGTFIRSHYRLFDSDHLDRIAVRIDEYQKGGFLTPASYTNFAGKYDLVGTIKNINGSFVLVVDHVPPVKIP